MSVLEVLALALPAFVANAAPVVVARAGVLEFLATPIDGGRMWRNRRLLGDHKTWRGLCAAVVFGALTGSVLFFLSGSGWALPPFTYTVFGACVFGAYAGFLCMLGDALKSVGKRQFDIASGRPFIPLDQIDYILMFLLGTFWLIPWDLSNSVFLIAFTFCINVLTNASAYALGIKATYW